MKRYIVISLLPLVLAACGAQSQFRKTVTVEKDGAGRVVKTIIVEEYSQGRVDKIVPVSAEEKHLSQ